MKTLALLSLVLSSAMATQAQGTVEFKNFDAATGWNVPVLVYHWSDPPVRLTAVSGTSYTVELVGGAPSGLNWKIIAQTNCLSGAQAGYFDGGVQAVPEVPSGSNAVLQIRVWATGAGSFVNAELSGIPETYGSSSLFTVATGTSNAPAKLVPLRTCVVAPLTAYATIYATFNRVNHTIDVIYSGVLESSSDLVKWSDVTTNLFSFDTYSFPLDQPSQFFRVR